MKKNIIFILLFSIFSSGLFAAVKVNAVETPYNTVVKNSNGVLQQTVISDDGMEVTVSSRVINSKVEYTIQIKNIQNSNFLMDNDCIQVFAGNLEKDKWREIDYEGGTKTGSVTVPTEDRQSTQRETTTNTNTSQSSGSEISDEEKCLIFGTACLCTIAVIDLLTNGDTDVIVEAPSPAPKASSRRAEPPRKSSPSSSSAPRSGSAPRNSKPRYSNDVTYSAPRRNYGYRNPHYHHHDTTVIWVIDDDYSSSRNNRRYEEDTPTIYSNNRGMVNTTSELKGNNYVGTIITDLTNDGDYRIRLTVSEDEYIDFYFSRSDKVKSSKNSNKNKTISKEDIADYSEEDIPDNVKVIKPREIQKDENGKKVVVRDENKSYDVNTIDDKLCLVWALGLPQVSTFGAYALFTTSSVGCYLGYTAPFGGIESNKNYIGFTNDHNYNDVVMYTTAPYPDGYDDSKEYRYGFKKEKEDVTDLHTIYCGLTFGLSENVYLMTGCGFSITNKISYGNYYWRTEDQLESEMWDQELCSGWIYDNKQSLVFVPQVGINFEFDWFDFGATAQLPILKNTYKPTFDLFVGFAL